MCGLVGIAARTRIADCEWLLHGRDAMRHRGPDDAGIYWSSDGRVGLAHRRLAIIDLTQGGHQPMLTDDCRICIVYNGEVYNFIEIRDELIALGHRFKSNSDTEVLLSAYRQWGLDFVGRLNGMFALAIHDRDTGRIILARDRAGEKPLYYRLAGGELRFSSELKGLLADPALPRKIDREALDCYLTMGYIPGDKCIFSGLSKLPPAHTLVFDYATGDAKIGRYWSLPLPTATPETTSRQELLADLETLLEAAVRRQMVADVPVGLLLSGGVDSSLITALAVRSAGQVKTYTVGFRQFRDFDETEHASLVANHFGTDHTVLEADAVAPEILPMLARQFDEPIVDSSVIPTFLVTRQIAKHCRVALGGDGGDELFGGYYSASRMARLQQLHPMIPSVARNAIGHAASSLLPLGFTGRAFAMMLSSDAGTELPIFAPKYDLASRKRLLADDKWPFVAETVWRNATPATVDAVQRITRHDFANYLPEDILTKVDRASMLNSLEVRSPYLDVNMIEFAFGRVPSSLKATSTDRKILLKQLAARLLPQGFDRKRKQGFGIPLSHWLRAGHWRDMFQSILIDTQSIFDQREIRWLFSSLDSGRPVKEQLFALAFFELWRREYGATF